MAVSFFQYNITSKPSAQSTKQAQNAPSTTVSKEVLDERAKQYKGSTPRELALLPEGYTITPANLKTKLTAEELFDLQ